MDICTKCKKEIVPEEHTTGYGTNKTGDKICYACCADLDRADMIKTGKIMLYLTIGEKQITVGNWPGSLVIPVSSYHKGGHNIAGCRHDVWFWFDSAIWHGVTYGDNTQLCHCKRTKAA